MRRALPMTGLPWSSSVGVVLPILGVFLGTLLIYHFNRDVSVNVGDLGDQPFVSGFYSDEADLAYRYRWTTGAAAMSMHGVGSAPIEKVILRVQSVNLGGSPQSQQLTISLNGQQVDMLGVPTEMEALTRTVAIQPYRGSWPLMEPIKVGLSTTTNRYPGDARSLGVKVDSVTVNQSAGGLNLPPVDVVFWPLALLAGIFGILSPFRRQVPLAATLVVAVAMLLAIAANVPLVSAYLPFFAAISLLAGVLVSQRSHLRAWPEWVEALGKFEVSRPLMLGAMGLYGIVALWTIFQSDWIGHADYAENAVVARNFVEGRGLSVDYVAQFYRDYPPSLNHPAETWPLLQPLLTAPFFAVFGPQTWVAKLPNLVVMLLLVWFVFHLSTRLWDSRVGLLAGLFVLLHPYFFNSVLYPINDLPFTALFFVLAWLVWKELSPWGRGSSLSGSELGVVTPLQPGRKSLVLVGVLSGLLVWSKPSGGVLLVGLLMWAAWTWRRYYRPAGVLLPWASVGVAVGTAILVLAPLVVRNLLAFGAPYFSTESFDAPILRYWNGDQTLWERIYKVYVGGELPHPRWIVGGKFGYSNLFDAIGRNFGWVWQRGVLGQAGEGDYILGLLPLAGALTGLAALTRRVASLFSMVALCLGLYALFVMLYWHFEGRYFQVAVPWLYMLLAWGIFWLWDRLRSALGDQAGRRWGLLLLPVAIAGLLWPSLSAIADQVERDSGPTGYVGTLNWLAANSAPDDVIMTRDPWELNWHTRRKAVMIPYDGLTTIESTARRYGVTMLQLGGPVDRVDIERCPPETNTTGPFPTGSRPALGALYCGRERPGYKLVYQNGGGTIYRLQPGIK